MYLDGIVCVVDAIFGGKASNMLKVSTVRTDREFLEYWWQEQ